MTKRNHDRPFPWRCGSCDANDVYRTPTAYQTTIKYEGRPYEVTIPDLELPKCRACGEVVFDNFAGEQIDRALRNQLALLQTEQIRAGRTQLGLNQREFAAHLGVAEESVSRWETGALVQSRIVDRQIRLYFEFPCVREALRQIEAGKAIGEKAQTERSDEGRSISVGSLNYDAQGRLLEEIQKTIDQSVRAALKGQTAVLQEVFKGLPR